MLYYRKRISAVCNWKFKLSIPFRHVFEGGGGANSFQKKIKTEKTPFQISTIMSIMGRGGGVVSRYLYKYLQFHC